MLRLRSLTIIKFSIATLLWFSLINSSSQLQAEPLSWSLSQRNSPDFSGDGRPRRTAGGASRGECQVTQPAERLTALIPNTSVALTVSSTPTFWFYVPYSLTSENSVELVLKDDQGNFVYQNKFSGKDVSSGIVSLSLPSTVELSTNQNYDWHFLIYCDKQNPEKFVYVNASIRQVESTGLKSQLSTTTKEERLMIYKQEKIWYDALNTTAKNLQTDPQNPKVQEDWFNLLQSVGLEHLADRSLNTYSWEDR